MHLHCFSNLILYYNYIFGDNKLKDNMYMRRRKMSISESWLERVPQPYWIETTPNTEYLSLEEDIKVDVAIVGGGIVGITAALFLKTAGMKVAIIEAGKIAKGTIGHTTAKITSQHDLIYDYIKAQYGMERAKQYADSNEWAIHKISDLVKENNIECNFLWKPAYIYTNSDKYVKKIEEEAKAAASVGIKAAYLDKIPLPISVKAALRFDEQAQFHPRKYMLALAKTIPGEGSHIFENTKAVDVKQGQQCSIITENGKRVTASKLIIASHYPFFDGMGLYFSRMHAERSYALGLTIKESFPEGMFITAEKGGISLRSQSLEEGGELIIASAESHKTGQGENMINHYMNLKDKVSKLYTIDNIMYRWSAQDYTTMDQIPYIGHLTSKTPNIYIATGFRKWGITTGTLAAEIIKDLIIKGENPWSSVYDPSRHKNAVFAGNFASQNIDVAKHLVKGKIEMLPHDIKIENGEAKKVNIEGQKIGAYRDEKGQLHLVDTTCTHMGCELVWNNAENTWDCPCHGSRFTYEGTIVEGPAINQLNHNNEEKNTIDPNII